ncbi:hypothetical protein R3P38DRAFT_2651173 [Favolaschia claudopus]|uniref:BTB domain-containing protein n=1 Tax=Favolaschia claudopus TaxID=2862362 RepID=A0AAW0A3L1_9AGAR
MSSTPTSPPPHTSNARIPFSGATSTDSDTRPTDFILRSCEGVDFHVRKDMLRALSDFFDDMFSMVREGLDGEDLFFAGKTVLAVPESTKVLYALLSIAYPRQQPSLGSPEKGLGIDDILEIMEAAQKYQFVVAEPLIKNLLGASALIQQHPHRIFAIARLHQLPVHIVREAALGTLRFSVTPLRLQFPEMDRISWSAAQRLFDFHQICGERVHVRLARMDERFEGGTHMVNNKQTQKRYIWWQRNDGEGNGFHPAVHNASCGARAGQHGTGKSAPWFTAHLTKLLVKIRGSPAPSTILVEVVNVAPSERALIMACGACKKFADEDLKNFAERLAVKVRLITEQVAEDYF